MFVSRANLTDLDPLLGAVYRGCSRRKPLPSRDGRTRTNGGFQKMTTIKGIHGILLCYCLQRLIHGWHVPERSDGRGSCAFYTCSGTTKGPR